MAQQTPPNNEQYIDDLHSIQSQLFTVTDQYKEWNKKAGINNYETRQTITNTTNLNKILNKSLDISSKIGKELVNEKSTRRAIKSLQAEAGKILSSYENTYRSLTSYQQKQVDILGQQQEQYQSLIKQAERVGSEIDSNIEVENQLWGHLISLEQQGLQTSREYLQTENELTKVLMDQNKIRKDKLQLETKAEVLNQDIKKAYNSQSVSMALTQREQVKAAESTLNILEDLPKEIAKGNKALKSDKFWKEGLSRVPILDQFSKIPKLIKEFGVGGVALLGLIGGIGAGLAKVVELMFKGDKEITDIQKGFSVTRDQAEGIRQTFYEIAGNASKFADIQKGTLITQDDIYQAQQEFNKAFGTAIVMSGQQLAQLAQIKSVIGLSEEGMKGLMTYSLGSGKSLEDISKNVLGTSRILQVQSGIQLNNKQILEDVLKVSGGIRANFKGNWQELSKAVTQAKLYGTSLEQVQHTSDSLLDFETSIESQLEAELLTGRQINLERARAAALVGDMNTVMSEMTKEAGDYSQFMKYNVITQNSLAKAFGYTRDEMADMLFQQKAINKLREAGSKGYAEEQKSLTDRYNTLVKLGKTTDELAGILGKDVFDTLVKQSAQEKFNKVIEKFEDMVGRLFDGGLIQKVVNYLAGIAEHLTSGGSLFGLLTNSSDYQAAQARVQAQLGSVQDGVISPKGAIMISTPKGQIATDPGDSIIATSNPGSLLNGGNSSNTKGVEAKLDQLIALISKGGNVLLDGKKVGTTIALGYNATL